MNRRGGYSPSPRGGGRQSWRKLGDSSPNSQAPVQAEASSKGRMSGSLDRKPQSSWQMKQHNSAGEISQTNENVTPTGRREQVRADAPSIRRASGSLDRKPHGSWQARGHNSDGVFSRNHKNVGPAGVQGERQGSSTIRVGSYFPGDRTNQLRTSSKASNNGDFSHDKQFGSSPVETKEPVNLDRSFAESVDLLKEVDCLSVSESGAEVPENNKIGHGNENEEKNEDVSTSLEFFDICPPKSSSVFTLKPSLLAKNREKRNEMKNSIAGPNGLILRSGMVLLKSYLSILEQGNILKTCHSHGLGPAGFYQPAFREGGKMHLHMMCFGEFWDPETSKYGKVRPIDHAKSPSVPKEFLLFVERAIKDSHSLIAEHSKVQNVEDILPSVKPDICIVNYYATTGRLGLHQDKDEGRESLNKGIPIVSFSIGDTAEFLYGDQRDVENANKVVLESGDVLIFGGKSRHIFHGVSTIKPDTAPKSLLEETNFRPGRLNLTFRQHL